MIASKVMDRSSDIPGLGRPPLAERVVGQSSPSSPSSHASAHVPGAADDAAHPALRVADEVLDSMVGPALAARKRATPPLRRASDEAGAVARRSVASLRDSASRLGTQLGDNARRSSQRTVSYIKEEPGKAILVAAAAAAIVIGLASLIGRLRDRD